MKRAERTVQGEAGAHFLGASPDLTFVKSGCTMLDLVLGGGWPLGRIANVVGDKSTGKTLLAIEAFANFNRQFPGERMWYREAESAFSKSYAQAIGMPVDKIRFWNKDKSFDTVEQFYEDLYKQANWAVQKNASGLYVLDSLDALSDQKEMEREFDANTYGTNKARQMSTLFRKLIRVVEQANLAVIVVSQIRASLARFGRNYSRTGGKAMDFYCSQVLYLMSAGVIRQTKNKQKRAIGVDIKARCEKNKIALPFRECAFPIRFAYGIEDLQACVDYLKGTRRGLSWADISPKLAKRILTSPDDFSDDDYYDLLKDARRAVKRSWLETERSFLPRRTKYGNQ